MTFINVSAKEVCYYENINNVCFTKSEYDFFGKMYYDGYQEVITVSEYNFFESYEMKPELIQTEIVSDYVSKATEVGSAAKTLKISKVSTSNTKISTVLSWHQNPTVRSYDVMGAYFSNVNLESSISTHVNYSNGSYYANDIQKNNNGFGVSGKLPENGGSIYISKTYSLSKGGTVYASYQHAIKNVSLANSKSYTIGYNGYGNVFIFNFGVGSMYDAMRGVSINT